MEGNLSEWLHLLLRWAHVFAGILWIGSTYFFTWLDHRLSEAAEAAAKGPGEGAAQVWMVHSGGFYVVTKQGAPELSQKLHWFRWEAAFTWITGVLLLGLVYYMGGTMVDDTVSNISSSTAIMLGIGLLVAGWFVYDLLWLSPLGQREPVGVAICIAALLGVTFGLTHVLSGRAAYMHVGAMMGTIMAANVWLRILPAQRQLIAATKAGGQPDAALAARAKGRSKHNTFMVVPVVFIMLSNHFPTASYGSAYNGLVLSVLLLLGFAAAKFLRH